jgi:hypothetical protein
MEEWEGDMEEWDVMWKNVSLINFFN